MARTAGAPGARAHRRRDVGGAGARDQPAAGRDRELRACGASAHRSARARPRAHRRPAQQAGWPGDSRRRCRDAPARSGAAACGRTEGDECPSRRCAPASTCCAWTANCARYGSNCVPSSRCRPRWPTRSICEQVMLNLLRNAMEACEVPRAGVAREITIEIRRDGINRSRSVSPTAAWASPKALWSRSSSPSIRPSPAAWASAWRSAASCCRPHGGALWAAHNPGGGALFQCLLPVATGD